MTVVHLTGSTWQTGDDLPYLRKIIDVIHECGGMIAHNWVETSYLRSTRGVKDAELDMKYIYDETLKAIQSSDIIIMEATTYSFFQGYQLALALRDKKPTLILSRYPIKGRIFYGMKDSLLTVKEYRAEKDLEPIVTDFLEKYSMKATDAKLEVPVDHQLHTYLKAAEEETGRSKAEILRDLAKRELRRRTDHAD